MNLFENFNFSNCFFVLLISVLHINGIENAKILAVFPFPGRSQSILVQPYLKALAAKGHEVTLISAYPQKTPVKNFRDIEVPEVMKYNDDVLESFVSLKKNKFQEILAFAWYFSTICTDTLNNSKVQKLLRSEEEHFDLIIVETLQTDVLYGFAEHFKAPLVGFSSYGTDPYIDALVNNISPLAYTPLIIGSSSERMSFLQRLENYSHNIIMWIHRVFMHNPLHNRLFKEFFPNATRSLEELRQNISLILLNQHYTMSFVRPYVANMIEVGGFHIERNQKALPQDINDFISSTNQSVIYFSMGSNIKSEHFPSSIRNQLLDTFARLPYKILWKFENPSLMLKKPKNVFIAKWFPQGDVLSNPQLQLFITHGGLLSCTEAIYYGKPLLGIPIFFDQIFNINRARSNGYALSVDYLNFNQTRFQGSIIELIENPKYAQKAKELSRRFRDQPMDPLEKALYWTEFVLRHNGSNFLRSPAQYLNIWQRNSFDTGGVVIGISTSLFFILILTCYKLINLIFKICTTKFNKLKKS